MCLGAIYWARLDRVWFACTRDDARAAGFDDSFIYDEIPRDPAQRAIPASQAHRERGLDAFREWSRAEGRILY